MNCKIVRDLLPLYHDGVCSPESREAVEAHLAGCQGCQAELAALDAPLPQETLQKNAADAAEVRTVAKAWRSRVGKARLKGALLAVLACAVLFGGWYGLTRWNIRAVPMADMEISRVRQLSDGRVLFHLFVRDDRTLNEVRYVYGKDGSQYLIPLRPVLCGKRASNAGLFNHDYLLDVAETNAWQASLGDGIVIRQVFLGQGPDRLLIWEEGMALPAASEEDEAAYGFESGSAQYWQTK